jgi:release factor glutamine methyltransferase
LAEVLASFGIESSAAEARWLVEAAAGMDREMLLMTKARLDEGVVAEALELTRRRAAGEPLQYITGLAGFRSLELRVGPGVLVPRPETEEVVGRAMERLPEDGVAIDVGTGSGAIALAIKDERPDARVLATEVSAAAMEWAEKNREELEIDIELIACDLMAGLPSDLVGEIDVIVANPPYVAETDRASLPTDVVDHEPHEALFAGERGTSVIERLSRDALTWLKPDGWLVLEIGETQGEVVGELLTDDGYSSVHVHRDLSGRDRIVEGRKP